MAALVYLEPWRRSLAVGNEVLVKREESPRSWCSAVVSAASAEEVKVLLFVRSSRTEWLRFARSSPDLKQKAPDDHAKDFVLKPDVSPCTRTARSAANNCPTSCSSEDSRDSGVQIAYVQPRELCRSDSYEVIDVSQSRSMNGNMFRVHHVPKSQFSSRLEALAQTFAYSGKTLLFCDRNEEDSDDDGDSDDDEDSDHRASCGVEFIRYLQANHPESTCTIRFLQGALPSMREHEGCI